MDDYANEFMESYLTKNFNLESKNPTGDALNAWRSKVSLVKNPVRRFRMISDGAKRSQTQLNRRILQRNFREALHLTDVNSQAERTQTELSAKQAGFEIESDILASLVLKRDIDDLNSHGGLEGIANKLHTSLGEGLSSTSSEMSLRRKAYGFNCFIEKPSKPFRVFIWEALHDILLIILMICAVISIGLGMGNGVYDGVGILLCIFLMVIVAAGSDYMQSLQFIELDKERKKNITVQVTRDGRSRQKVSICDLVVGDIVHLSTGDQVPADGLFISGYSLTVDESNLSGDQSAPVINISENNPFLLSGAKVQDGSGKMLVVSICMRTEWGISMEDENETPLQVKLNGVATVIGKIGLVFSILTFMALTSQFLISHREDANWSTMMTKGDLLSLLNFFAIAVTIIIMVIPEGLPLAVTLSLAFATRRLTNDNALVRRLSALETMGAVSCICTDKTGTLTTNQMLVTKLWMIRGEAKRIDREVGLNALKSSLSKNSLDLLLQSIFQNTSAEIFKFKVSGTPTETALIEFALLFEHENWTRGRIRKIEPFNSIKKTMSVLVDLPNGKKRAFCKGASEIVLRMSDKIINENGESIPLSDDNRKNITKVINEFAHQSLRTICLAFKDMIKENELKVPDDQYTLVAVIGIKNPVRPGVKEAVKTCLAAGISVKMVTGDSLNTAIAIARECGILTEDGLTIEGHDFREKSPEELKTIIPKLQVMARSLPMDKHKLVTRLIKHHGEVVAVTGDDINDVPALQEADIGLAMGIAGTEVAKENADIVIMDDNFTTIVNVATWGRSVYANIQKFVQFHLMSNIIVIWINLISACISGSAILNVAQLLWVNMIMDTLGALALTTEPPNDELMKGPPIRRYGSFIRILTTAMWRDIFMHSYAQLSIFLIINYLGTYFFLEDEDSIFKTIIFNCVVFIQVFNMIRNRGVEKVNSYAGIFKSQIFCTVVVSTVFFQVIMVEFLSTFMGTTPLCLILWLVSVIFTAYIVQFTAFVKYDKDKRINTEPSKKRYPDDYEPLPSGLDLA